MHVDKLPDTAALYSLLHLDGFPGDLAFYSSRCSSAGVVVEMGAGEGRVAKALHAELGSSLQTYVGVEIERAFVDVAQERLENAGAGSRFCVLQGDMLEPLPAGTPPADAVLLTSNVLFATPEHSRLLARCAEALVPGGTLLLDCYNARDFHLKPDEDEYDDEDEDAARLGQMSLKELKAEAARLGIADPDGHRGRKKTWADAIRGHLAGEDEDNSGGDDNNDGGDLLRRVCDGAGREWCVEWPLQVCTHSGASPPSSLRAAQGMYTSKIR